jgi:AcrR family transcriptional regulator
MKKKKEEFSPSPRRGKTKEDLMRSLILDRSESLFTAVGYHKTSMDQIAAESGISKPTLYKYFENKYELFSTLFFRFQEEYIANIRRVLLQNKPRAKILEELVESCFHISTGRRSFFLMMIREHHLVVHRNIDSQIEVWLSYREQVIDVLTGFFSGWVKPSRHESWGAREVAEAVQNILEGIFYEVLFCETCNADVHKRFFCDLLQHGVLTEED